MHAPDAHGSDVIKEGLLIECVHLTVCYSYCESLF